MDGRTLLALALLASLAGSCSTNELGRLSASKLGDLSHGPAPREPFDAAVRAACGDLEVMSGGHAALPRLPYVQRVTHDSATIMWTSTLGDAAEVEVFPASDPSRVLSAEPEVEVTTPRLPLQWTARVDGLDAGAVHCFRVKHDGETLLAGAGFRAAPSPGSEAPVSFVTFGDLGTRGIDQLAVRDQVETVPFDFALINGDVAYEDGTFVELENNFFGVYERQLTHVPYFVASGNHDYRTDDAAPFRSVFALFRNGGKGGIERWYSFDWGPLHVVVLDTEKIGALQATWLDTDLTANVLPWVVVVGHRPAFSSGHHGPDEGVQRTFVPLFEKHGVSLVIAGHDHNYERTHPIRGVTYVVAGAGGRGTRSVGSSIFTAFSEAVSHFVHVVVDGDKLVGRAIDANGQDFDSFAIERP